MHRNAARRAQSLQPRHIAGRLRSEGEIVAAENRSGVQTAHQHLIDELLGRKVAEFRKGRFHHPVHAERLHARMLDGRGKNPPAFQGVAGREFKGKDSRAERAAACCPDRCADHRPVAKVNAVKIAKRHRTALWGINRANGRDQTERRVHAILLSQKSFSTRRTPPSTAATPRNAPLWSYTR